MNLSPGCALGNLTVPLPAKIVSKKIPLTQRSNRKKTKKSVHNLIVDIISIKFTFMKVFLKILLTTNNYA